MQTDIVEDLLAEDGGRLARDFDGFTLFEDNLGAFPYTHMSVPAMLGGLAYDNSEVQGPFLDRALGPGSIFGAAKAAGYEVEVGEPGGGLVEVYRHVRDAQVIALPDSPVASWRGDRQDRLLLGDLVLFRILPHFAKAYVYNDGEWLLQGLFGNTSMPGRSFLTGVSFLRDLSRQARVDDPRPSYKFLHLMLSHRPMVMNADCSYAAHVLDPSRAHVRDQARCAFRELNALIARLRALGIYDNTTIVISGDHGTFIAPGSIASGSPDAKRAYAMGLPPTNIGQARPLLLVKPAHASGALRHSSAPSWIIDTPATIADAAGIPAQLPGTSAFRIDPAAPRERRFNVYEYVKSDWSSDYLAPMQEFLVNGRSDRVDSWSRGRRLEAAGAR
jgi:hypothetical protein